MIKPILICATAGFFCSYLQANLKVDPAPVIQVKNEKFRMPAKPSRNYNGGYTLRQVQVFKPGRGLPAFGSVQPGSVKVHQGNKDLIKDKDYLVDYQWGKISPTPKSSIKSGTPLTVDYAYRLRRLDSLVKNNSGKEYIRKGKPHLNTPRPPALAPGEKRIANIFIDYDCDGTNAEVYEITEPADQAETATTRGRIPRTLAKIKSGKPVKIVCWGDSVTCGGDASSPAKRYTAQFESLLKKKFPQANITVKVVAAGGSNSKQWLFPEEYKYRGRSDICRWEKVAKEKPDLITLEFVNDAWMNEPAAFKQYDEIMKKVKAINAEIIIITPHFTMKKMMGFKNYKEKEKRKYVHALRKFARTNNLAVADASARWEHLAKEGMPYIVYLKNAINHPDDDGHLLFAEELIKNFD